MRLTVNLPMVFDAQIDRHRGVKTIAVSRSVSRDIPAISATEASVVLKVNTDGIQHYGHMAEFPLIIPRGSRPIEIREYEGRLFRKLSSDQPREECGLDREAFPDIEQRSPIGKPIKLHFEALLHTRLLTCRE
jgi:hypothetical protein